jgi:hypothetical protein
MVGLGRLKFFRLACRFFLALESPKPYILSVVAIKRPPKRKQTPMTNSSFIRLMLAIPVTFGLLVGGCINAASAADQTREPGRCVRSEVLVTDRKTGEQHISVHTVCECSAEHPCTSRVASR